MTRSRIVPALISAWALVACDDGPSFTVTPEPAGANCPTGGFLIEADGQTFYSCNGQATTEEIPEGAEGNPCFGPALRVSVPTAEGTRYAYVCQPIEPDAPSADIVLAPVRISVAAGTAECVCAETPEQQAACDQQIRLYAGVLRVSEGCLPDVLAVAGPVPESERASVECITDAFASGVACIEALDTSECSMAYQEAAGACFDMFDAVGECPETAEAYDDWRSRVAEIAEFLGCPIFGGS